MFLASLILVVVYLWVRSFHNLETFQATGRFYLDKAYHHIHIDHHKDRLYTLTGRLTQNLYAKDIGLITNKRKNHIRCSNRCELGSYLQCKSYKRDSILQDPVLMELTLSRMTTPKRSSFQCGGFQHVAYSGRWSRGSGKPGISPALLTFWMGCCRTGTIFLDPCLHLSSRKGSQLCGSKTRFHIRCEFSQPTQSIRRGGDLEESSSSRERACQKSEVC